MYFQTNDDRQVHFSSGLQCEQVGRSNRKVSICLVDNKLDIGDDLKFRTQRETQTAVINGIIKLNKYEIRNVSNDYL